MINATGIFISTSLLNPIRSFPSLRSDPKDDPPIKILQGVHLKAAENHKWHMEGTVPEQSGKGSVPDPIGAPAERRKGGPQEEFIDVDPNFTKEMPEEEKEELLERARKENKKEN